MSGYADDLTPRTPDARDIELARAAVKIPAFLLIVVGAIALVGSIWGLIQLPQVPAKMDEVMAEIEADPNIPDDQKATAKRILTMIKEAAEDSTAAVGYVIGIVGSLVVILGGVQLMRLSGRVLPITGSILAMVPCTVGCCCLLGFPVGVWALIAMNRPGVRDVIAYRRTAPPPNPDEQYMR